MQYRRFPVFCHNLYPNFCPKVSNYRANYLGKVYDVNSSAELEHLEETLENSGLYPLRVSPEEVKAFEADKSLVEKQFGQLASQRIGKWLQIAEERLHSTGIKCFVHPGNDDPYAIDQVFKPSDFVKNVDETVVMLDEDHEMVSVRSANQTPWHCPRDLPEEELTRRIEGMIEQLKNPANAIFNLHVPPYDANLDVAPEIDENLTPKLSLAGGFKMISVGSKAVRAAIEKYQPLMGLHGQIHESRSAQKIGRPMGINPGSEYGEGVLRGVIVDLSKQKLENYTFTMG